MGRMGEQIPRFVKAIITAFAAILAASQLGIDTTVINIVVSALVAGLALAFALIVGFGSRPVATEIASGRALRRLVTPGDIIASSSASGTVVAMHPTAVELAENDSVFLVPNTVLADSSFTITRPEKQPEANP
jgi:small-conductance mechanosensitive channel